MSPLTLFGINHDSISVQILSRTHYSIGMHLCSLFQHILDHLAADQQFCIVGYSYGGLIALEMVKLLEKQNRSGQLWLIDSSPEFLKVVAATSILSDTVKTEDELQVNVITRFLENIWPEATNVVRLEFCF